MKLRVDPSSPVPLYLQIADRVRRAVAVGLLRPGDRIPPVREIAARAAVNRNTAARAVQWLEGEGVVRSRVGQGTFVADPEAPSDPGRRDRTMDEALDRLLLDAHTLGVPLEEIGWRLARRIEAWRREGRAGGARGSSDAP